MVEYKPRRNSRAIFLSENQFTINKIGFFALLSQPNKKSNLTKKLNNKEMSHLTIEKKAKIWYFTEGC